MLIRSKLTVKGPIAAHETLNVAVDIAVGSNDVPD